MLFKIEVLKNFTNFTGKQLRWSLILIKLKTYKETPTHLLSCKILEILRTRLFTEPLRWLLLGEVGGGPSLVKILQSLILI